VTIKQQRQYVNKRCKARIRRAIWRNITEKKRAREAREREREREVLNIINSSMKSGMAA